MTAAAWWLVGGVVVAVVVALAVVRHIRRERGVVEAVEGAAGETIRVGVEQMVSKALRRSYEVEGIVEAVEGHSGGRAIRFADGARIHGLEAADAMTDRGTLVVALADIRWIEMPDGSRSSL